jgi:putative flippase GtrA
MGSLFRWGILSVCSFALVLGVTALCREAFGTSERVAFAIALATSFTVNFAACKFFVFPGSAAKTSHQVAMYAATTGSSRVIEYAVFWVLLEVLQLHYLAVATLVLATASVLKFAACKWVIFKPSIRVR